MNCAFSDTLPRQREWKLLTKRSSDLAAYLTDEEKNGWTVFHVHVETPPGATDWYHVLIYRYI